MIVSSFTSNNVIMRTLSNRNAYTLFSWGVRVASIVVRSAGWRWIVWPYRSWITVFLSGWRRRIVSGRSWVVCRNWIVNWNWITVYLSGWRRRIVSDRRRIVSRRRRLIKLWRRTIRWRRFVDYWRRYSAVRSGYDLRSCNNLMMLVNMLNWSRWKSCRYRK